MYKIIINNNAIIDINFSMIRDLKYGSETKNIKNFDSKGDFNVHTTLYFEDNGASFISVGIKDTRRVRSLYLENGNTKVDLITSLKLVKTIKDNDPEYDEDGARSYSRSVYMDKENNIDFRIAVDHHSPNEITIAVNKYKKDCLLMIDLQKGFLNSETNYVIDEIKELVEIEEFYYKVATKFVNSENSPHHKFLDWKGMEGGEEAELDDYIASIADIIIEKNTNSCFTDEFEKFLAEKGIEEIWIVGLDTDCCVMKTAYDCFDRKIPFRVELDCCASSGGKEFHEAACKVMIRNLGAYQVLSD